MYIYVYVYTYLYVYMLIYRHLYTYMEDGHLHACKSMYYSFNIRILSSVAVEIYTVVNIRAFENEEIHESFDTTIHSYVDIRIA